MTSEPESHSATQGRFFPISPLLLFPGTSGRFMVYIKLNDRFMLYANPDEPFSLEQRKKLYDNGVTELWVASNEKDLFKNYLEKNLGGILENDNLPLEERSRVFFKVSLDILRETFEANLPESMSVKRFEKILKFVTAGTRYLAKGGSLKSLASMISHDYKTYSHSVHVFIYTTAILQAFDLDEKALGFAGMGAILHDMGKTAIPKEIINKPGPLSGQEWDLMKTHPIQGAALCANVPLSQESVNIILLHHERFQGGGYPSGIRGEDIPLLVRAVSLADAYDALVSDRSYAQGKTPFQALTTIKEEMKGHFDPKVFKAMIQILSGAEIV